MAKKELEAGGAVPAEGWPMHLHPVLRVEDNARSGEFRCTCLPIWPLRLKSEGDAIRVGYAPGVERPDGGSKFHIARTAIALGKV